jgi:hypothetical protein
VGFDVAGLQCLLLPLMFCHSWLWPHLYSYVMGTPVWFSMENAAL